VLTVEVDDFPAQAVKLIEEGFLDMVAFVEFVLLFIIICLFHRIDQNALSKQNVSISTRDIYM
jgi:hypothetical protein